VLLSWSLKSTLLYRQLNIDAWLEQQAADDGGYSKLSELTTTSTPYIGPRLKLLTEYARSPELAYWRKMISDSIRQAAPPPRAVQAQGAPPQQPQIQSAQPAQSAQTQPAKTPARPDVLRLKCAACQTPMRVPLKVLAGKTELPVKCPNAQCGKITRLKKGVRPAAKAAGVPKPKPNQENMSYDD
jgi:hypothetical protein